VSKSRPLRDYADGNDNMPGDSREYTAYGERADADSYGESGFTDYSEALPAYTGEYASTDSAYHDAYDEGYTGEYSAEVMAQPYGSSGLFGPNGQSAHGGELVPVAAGANLPTPATREASAPLVIPGSGVAIANPFIKRRKRPLSLRIATFVLIGAVLLTSLFASIPLTSSADSSPVTPFEALAGAVVLHQQVAFFWYTAQAGDSPEKLAQRFNVQVGGIYELNNLLAGEELTIGEAYKIPEDPNYGADYRPPSISNTTSTYGKTIFGTDWWNSYAGAPGPEAACGVNGHGNYLAYDFVSPNPHSYWVRGFSWFHDGVDLSAPQGNPIHAAQGGQVIWAGYDATNGFGWSVVINHCNHVSTLYGHMLKVFVKAHDNVVAGEEIGLEGSTGWSTGPHLHISVMWDNVMIDPMLFYTSIAAITGQ